jgi:beta-N-acetylhexosaminidase
MARTRVSLKSSNLGDNFIIGFEGTAMTPALEKLLKRIQPAGVILFRRNIESAEQTWQLLKDCQRHVSTPLFTCVDMEGGTVDRLREVFGPSPSAASVFATGDAKLFALHGKLIGAICRAVGFNVDFAPTLDLALPPSLPVMQSRVVSADPRRVTQYARAFLRGLAESRVMGCGKHFPGLGEVSLDTHKDLPVVEKPLRPLLAEDAEPYRILRRELPFVMVSHTIYAGHDSVPASLSKKWMADILRKKLGYAGLVITDDMEMGALQKAAPMADAAVQALSGGADLLLICHSEDQIDQAHEAVSRERDRNHRFAAKLREATGRIARVKKKFASNLAASPRPSQAKVERLSRLLWEFGERIRLGTLEGKDQWS